MGALKRLIADISEKMLIQQLREMEADSLARPLRPGERLPEASPAQRRRYASDARQDAPHPRRGTLRIVLMPTHKWTFLQVQGQTRRRKPYKPKTSPAAGSNIWPLPPKTGGASRRCQLDRAPNSWRSVVRRRGHRMDDHRWSRRPWEIA